MFDPKRLLGLLTATGMGGMNRRTGFDSHGLGKGGMGVPGLGAMSMGGGLGGALDGLAGGGAILSMLGRPQRGGTGKLVGLGLLGALAYRAMQKRAIAGNELPAVPEDAAEALDQAAEGLGADEATLMVRAMIAAASADGQMDDEERLHVLEQLEEAGASEEDRQFIERELLKPVSVEELVRGAVTPEARLNLYAVSLLAINVDRDAERSYLAFLADHLGLAWEDLKELHRQAGLAWPAA